MTLKYLYLPILLLCLPPLSQAQARLTQAFQPKFSNEIESQLKEGKLRITSAAYYYTYIDDYEKALNTYELPLAWGLDSMSSQDSLNFLKFQAVDAFDYLKEKTKKAQVIVISEAHQKPQHRIFTARLLPILQENGFKYLGLETLGRNTKGTDSTFFLADTLLNERGYPLYMPLTGTYTLEPQMGNLARIASSLGMALFAYERTTKENDRDLQQAMNIKAFLDKHPGEKIVIQCGWYHAIESKFPKGRKHNWMAYHLKQLTGIDPLTIYQDALTEKRILKESPYYTMHDLEEISVFVDKQGKIFNGVDSLDHFDILLYHPRTKYDRGRPSWLLTTPGNKFVKIKKKAIVNRSYPLLIKAFPRGDSKDATPVDIIELENPGTKTFLALKKGVYTISIVDKDRKEYSYTQKVR